eukprot:7068762-Prorocentrum_lima.AAC.1
MTSSLVGSEMCIRDRNMTNPMTFWYNYRKERYTPSIDKWPKVGCGARFLPWAKGASMVAEMKMPDG